jgi:hypothetical protein
MQTRTVYEEDLALKRFTRSPPSLNPALTGGASSRMPPSFRPKWSPTVKVKAEWRQPRRLRPRGSRGNGRQRPDQPDPLTRRRRRRISTMTAIASSLRPWPDGRHAPWRAGKGRQAPHPERIRRSTSSSRRPSSRRTPRMSRRASSSCAIPTRPDKPPPAARRYRSSAGTTKLSNGTPPRWKLPSARPFLTLGLDSEPAVKVADAVAEAGFPHPHRGHRAGGTDAPGPLQGGEPTSSIGPTAATCAPRRPSNPEDERQEHDHGHPCPDGERLLGRPRSEEADRVCHDRPRPVPDQRTRSSGAAPLDLPEMSQEDLNKTIILNAKSLIERMPTSPSLPGASC